MISRKRPFIKRKSKTEQQKKMNKEEGEKMMAFFLTCWDEEMKNKGEVRCFETGRLIPKSLRENTLIYHHVLHKQDSQYPQFKFEKWNIRILWPEVHAQVHLDIDRTPKIKKLTEELKQIYG